jgi:hypothetical protein
VTRILITHRGHRSGEVYVISFGTDTILGEGTTDYDILGKNPVEILYCLPLTLEDQPKDRLGVDPSDQVIKGVFLRPAGMERGQYVRCGAFTVKSSAKCAILMGQTKKQEKIEAEYEAITDSGAYAIKIF